MEQAAGLAPCPSRATGCTLPAARFSGTQQLSRSKNSFPYRQDGKTGSTASPVTRGPHLGELPSQQPGQKEPLTCLCRTEPLAGISARGLLSSEHPRPSLSFEPRGDSSDSASDGPEARPGREPPGKRPSTLGKLDVHSGLHSHCGNRGPGRSAGRAGRNHGDSQQLLLPSHAVLLGLGRPGGASTAPSFRGSHSGVPPVGSCERVFLRGMT